MQGALACMKGSSSCFPLRNSGQHRTMKHIEVALTIHSVCIYFIVTFYIKYCLNYYVLSY